jgi:hypothetical protein
LDLSEKTRLEKLLGMLGSSFDGERATAAAMIQRMAEAKKLTINELIAQAHMPAAFSGYRQPPPPPPPEPEPRYRESEPDFTDIDKAYDLLKMLRRIAEKPDIAARVLTPWEINFSTDVSARYSHDYDLSEKQLVIVEKILRKASRVFT